MLVVIQVMSRDVHINVSVTGVNYIPIIPPFNALNSNNNTYINSQSISSAPAYHTLSHTCTPWVVE